MGCCGEREKGPPEHTAKFSYLTLSDFTATSAWTSVAYLWLWFMAVVGVAAFAVDTFTAVNLLFFNKWSSQVQPALPFQYSRWIFAGCIMLSWALYIYEWQRAIRVIRRDGVAESYMDPLAVSLQSMRGQGWRRFLVFSELTKSRKGADYVALFVYFAFQGAVRVALAEGPRQAINGMTLYAVLRADIIDAQKGDHPAIVQFWLNLQALADQNKEQVAIYFSMLFTLIIWVFSALSLIFAALAYILFLWHYVPQRDGRLSIYCRRKIDKRLESIVENKVKAAMKEEERQKRKAEERELRKMKNDKSGLPPAKPKVARQPTLPMLGGSAEPSDDEEDQKVPEPKLYRQDTNTTVSTLPQYSSRPPTRNGSQKPLPGGPLSGPPNGPPGGPMRSNTQSSGWSNNRPGMGPRAGTQASGFSNTSYGDDAPLLANAGYAGDGPRAPTAPPAAFSRQDSNASFGPQRGMRGPGPDPRAMGGPFSPVSRAATMSPGQSQPPLSRLDTMESDQSFPPVARAHTMGDERSFSPLARNGDRAYSPAPGGPPNGPPNGPPRSFTPGGQGPPYGRPPPGGPMNGPPRAYTPGGPGQPYPRPPPGGPVNGPPRSYTPFGQGPAPGRSPPNGPMSAGPVSNGGFDFALDSRSVASNSPVYDRPGPPGRHGSSASSFSQRSASSRQAGPMLRQNSNQAFGRASPPGSDERSSPNSYEMKAQPSHNQPPANGGYVAFNPNMRNANASPAPASTPPAAALRGVTVVGGPGTEESYFGHVREASLHPHNNVSPAPSRLTTGYDDILDDYNLTPSDVGDRRPSPHGPPSRSQGGTPHTPY